MILNIDGQRINIEAVADSRLLELIHILRTKRNELDDQMAAVAAERFSRKTSFR